MFHCLRVKVAGMGRGTAAANAGLPTFLVSTRTPQAPRSALYLRLMRPIRAGKQEQGIISQVKIDMPRWKSFKKCIFGSQCIMYCIKAYHAQKKQTQPLFVTGRKRSVKDEDRVKKKNRAKGKSSKSGRHSKERSR